VHLSGIED